MVVMFTIGVVLGFVAGCAITFVFGKSEKEYVVNVINGAESRIVAEIRSLLDRTGK